MNCAYTSGCEFCRSEIFSGVRMPATTSSPCALRRYSPKSSRAPVFGSRVNATPVPESSPMLPNTIETTLTAVPQSSGHLVVRAVVDGTLGIPRVEYGADRKIELLVHVLREVALGFAFDDVEILRNQRFPIGSRKLRIGLDAELRLRAVEQMIEMFFVDLEHDARKHRDEAPVRVVGETIVIRELRKSGNGLAVQPEVENRVHHPGHRHARTAAHRHEQRIRRGAEAFFGALLELAHRRVHVAPEGRAERCGRRDRIPGTARS